MFSLVMWLDNMADNLFIYSVFN